jgi:hypothetical protein
LSPTCTPAISDSGLHGWKEQKIEVEGDVVESFRSGQHRVLVPDDGQQRPSANVRSERAEHADSDQPRRIESRSSSPPYDLDARSHHPIASRKARNEESRAGVIACVLL